MTTDARVAMWAEHDHTRALWRAMFTALWLLPRNSAIAIMKAYRRLISPLYGEVCRYYPSCSMYSLQAYQKFGLVRGIWLTLIRLVRCNPFTPGGIDDVPSSTESRYTITQSGFVVPARRKGHE